MLLFQSLVGPTIVVLQTQDLKIKQIVYCCNQHQTHSALWLISFLQQNEFYFQLILRNILVWTPWFSTTIITERPVLIKNPPTKLSQKSRKKGPPLAFSVATDDWYDSKPIQTANFTHDWGSIGCNEMAFLNIALEWLCDHQHNSCYYSFGPSTHFSLYQVHRVIIAELGVNPRLWFLAATDVTIFSTGSNSQCVNWPPQSLSRFMESLRGHRRLPGEAVQGAKPAPELRLGNFWPL